MKVDRVDTADLGTKFLDAARRKQLIGMLFLREHARRHERVVDGRSAKESRDPDVGVRAAWRPDPDHPDHPD